MDDEELTGLVARIVDAITINSYKKRITGLEAENAKLLAFKNTCITDVELLELQRLREALKVIASCGATMTIGEMREHALAALEIGDE
jgi:hypothetical protein